jgi:hypothetical protein
MPAKATAIINRARTAIEATEALVTIIFQLNILQYKN